MLLRTDAPVTGTWQHRHLSERDARLLTEQIVKQVFALGAACSEFGIHLNADGFYFCAEVNGRRVWVQTGQSNFTYQRVAADLIAAAVAQASNPSPLAMSTI